MKTFAELTFEQQDQLAKSLHEYHVETDPYTMKQYVRFMGESIDFRTITRSNILLG